VTARVLLAPFILLVAAGALLLLLLVAVGVALDAALTR